MRGISTIAEYLKTVRQGVLNADKMIEAMFTSAMVKNKLAGHNVDITDEAIAEIMRRKDICASCPFNSKNAIAAGIHSSNLPYDHCIHCYCRIGYDDSKEYCLSCKCGISEYNKKNPNNPLPLRWESFQPKNNL